MLVDLSYFMSDDILEITYINIDICLKKLGKGIQKLRNT